MSKKSITSHEPEKHLLWYLVYTKPRLEFIAQENLERQGFNVYLPLYKIIKKPTKNSLNKEINVVREPMFPRYLFVQAKHREQSLSTIQYTRGVLFIVRFGQNLASLPQKLIDDIKTFEKVREDTNIEDMTPFKPGTRVRLNQHSGLEHLEGLVQTSSTNRVTILLEIMGGLQKVTTKPSYIDIIN